MHLHLTQPLTHGPAVRRWQELLIALGYDLGRWGADGWFGTLTHVATITLQQRLGVAVDGIVGPDTLEAAQRALGAPQLVSAPVVWEQDGVEVHDYRHLAPPPKNYSRPRAWSEIKGIMLHRTGGMLGEDPARWLIVNAHIGITLGGRIILMQSATRMIWHGHGPSPWTIGIEIDGNPEGKPGYYWRPGGGPHDVTEAQILASRVLLDILLKDFAANGQLLQCIVAHRQSHASRECDPGWQVWQQIAIPWMAETGARPGPGPDDFAGATYGSGQPIPREWDSRSTVPFWR